MRTIKFRGKRLDNGEWAYGCIFINDKGYAAITTLNTRGEYAVDIKVDPETIGQFTGLSDKNGKEIYEGDILEMWLEDSVEPQGGYFHRMYVVFTSEIGFTLWGECMTMEDAEPLYELLQWKDCEVIGNVHDNPELLIVQQI